MSSRDSLVVRLAEAVANPDETLGVLVHGSYATGASYTDSDIDLICVIKSEQRKRFIQSVNGFKVDVFRGSRRQIDNIFHSDVPNNNNLVLYAFVQGRPMIDRDGSIAELMDVAGRVWIQGPAAPTQEEKERIQTASRLAFAGADRMKARAIRSLEWRELARLYTGTLFVDCLFAYCRINRLWASAIWEMLKWSDIRYEYIQTEIRTYLNEPSLESRLRAIRRIAQATITMAV